MDLTGRIDKLEPLEDRSTYERIDRDPDGRPVPVGDPYTTRALVLRVRFQLEEGNTWYGRIPLPADTASFEVGQTVTVTVK